MDGLDLPCFAAVDLLRTTEGTERLRRYYDSFADLAQTHNTGLILETPTWRASADWGHELGYTPETLEELNRASVRLMKEIRDRHGREDWVISGCIGPRGEGYVATRIMSADEAQTYHAVQIGTLAEAGVDLISAFPLNTIGEAVGATRAAQAAGVPSVISFTVETDGTLPSGITLREAIEGTDVETNRGPAYYMVNCAHPSHFADVLEPGSDWTRRIAAIRANASCKSHAELEASTELDAGDPIDMAHRLAELVKRLPHIRVLGGCCGTDLRHIRAIAHALA